MRFNQSDPAMNDFRPTQATSEATSSLQQTGILLISSSTALAVGITALRMYAKGKAKHYWWGKSVVEGHPAESIMLLMKSPGR